MREECIESIDLQLFSEEDMFLWLQRGNLKAETESEIITAQDQELQTKSHAKKCYKQEQIARADCVSSLTRWQTTLCQHTEYWQKYST